MTSLDSVRSRELVRSPNAVGLLEPLCRCYVERLLNRDDNDPAVRDLLVIAATVLGEIKAGRDIPAELAEAIRVHLEDRTSRDSHST
jgi:hypothetical protein